MAKEKLAVEKSPFYFHFKNLRRLGAWRVARGADKKEIVLYSAFKFLMLFFSICGIYFLLLDLVMVFGQLKKLTWNLCVTSLFLGSLIKNLIIFGKSHVLERLQRNLHRDAESRVELADVEMNVAAKKHFRYLQISAYGSFCVLVPIWLLARYFRYLWGEREWPVPFGFPASLKIDINDDRYYTTLFLLFGLLAICGLVMVLEQELAMIGIIIQLSREFKVFLNHIPKLNNFYETSEYSQSEQKTPREINPCLKERRTKAIVKEISLRQQELMQYTKDFEFCYSHTFLLQFFTAIVLVVVTSLQCIMEAVDISVSLIYELGYIIIILIDIFTVCWFSTKINAYSLEIGRTVYSTLWYNMPRRIQKDILLIIMRSQVPPKITAGKMLQMNLHAFTIFMRNVYSWLALFMQLELKVNI